METTQSALGQLKNFEFLRAESGDPGSKQGVGELRGWRESETSSPKNQIFDVSMQGKESGATPSARLRRWGAGSPLQDGMKVDVLCAYREASFP